MSHRSLGSIELEDVTFTVLEGELKPCGDCKACCTVVGVVELEKQNYQRCHHLCTAGCEIYDSKPESCTEYQCWYTQGLVEGRPDRIGLIVDFQMTPLPGLIRVWEVREGASETRKGKRLISKLLQYDSEVAIVNRKQTKMLRSGQLVPTAESVQAEPVDEAECDEIVQSVERFVAGLNEERSDCN